MLSGSEKLQIAELSPVFGLHGRSPQRVLAGLVHGARGFKANFTWNSVGIARETRLLRKIQ